MSYIKKRAPAGKAQGNEGNSNNQMFDGKGNTILINTVDNAELLPELITTPPLKSHALPEKEITEINTKINNNSEVPDLSKGWVKLPRDLLKTHIFKPGKPQTHFEAFVLMHIYVNHTQIEVEINDKTYVVTKGQSIKSKDSWAKLFNWNRQRVGRFFKKLQKLGLIKIENLINTTRITILSIETAPKAKKRYTKAVQTAPKYHVHKLGETLK